MNPEQLLWTPSAERIAGANVTAFRLAAEQRWGVKLPDSAASSPAWRNTQLEAPVTATRTPASNCATNTPTSEKREAGCLNFM